MEQQAPVLEVRELTKRFPGVLALDRVSCTPSTIEPISRAQYRSQPAFSSGDTGGSYHLKPLAGRKLGTDG